MYKLKEIGTFAIQIPNKSFAKGLNAFDNALYIQHILNDVKKIPFPIVVPRESVKRIAL